MSFIDVLDEKWPPIIDGVLVRSHKTDRISNYFSQYLQWLIQGYIKISPNLNYLQEIECDNHLHKLDYMILENGILDYFKGKNPKNVNWAYLIESQWGNNNLKKLNDFIHHDFPKLKEWETVNDKQCKVALIDMTGYKTGNEKENHDFMFSELVSTIDSDVEGKYHIIVTTRNLQGKYVVVSKYNNKGLILRDIKTYSL